MAETKIKNERGQQLYARYWNEDDSPKDSYKALVFIVHGYCEHCLPYTELAKTLIDKGFYVFAHDHVGHGQSEGDRAHVIDFDDYVNDVFCHIDQVKNKFPDKPVFLIGHSMGGAISVLAAMARPTFFSGVILIGPLITPDRKAATPFKIALGKMVAKVLPQMHIAKLDPKTVSRDSDYVKTYTNDPLNYHNGVKCRWGVAMLDALKKIEDNVSDIDWPFFILHGDKDALCELDGSKLMYDKAKSTDKKIKIFEGAFHQLHNELEPVKKETFNLISDWLNERV
ncbi:monoglyceride lipase-like [Ruditapes philippinarum]|uniref:monoglyceride lipase-like n=1 Tax=Ruditapes philippinarum TaxID=129788 RepID=UPI00295C2E97|nr:monoglyceride lipase-like [Ruditapes philippinarum]